MKLGVSLRNMGTQSKPETLLYCAAAAQASGCHSLWVTDHIAIPPDDAEGSGGRYLDTLTTLAWLGGATSDIHLGSGVLNLPYRPKLPIAKQIATLQELTGGRLMLGVGIGWMDAEFRALGLDRHQRGRISDETLAFLQTCFANDEVTLNGQPFLFRPRPPKPPFLIGGRAPHALRRAVSLGDGWLPMARDAAQIADDVETYRSLAADAGRGTFVAVMTRLPGEQAAAHEIAAGFAELGVDELIVTIPYDEAQEFEDRLGGTIETITDLLT